jgi:hypothetical protein
MWPIRIGRYPIGALEEQVGDEHSSECRIASIGPDDVMILPHDANPGRIEFSETTRMGFSGTTPVASDQTCAAFTRLSFCL